MTRLTEKKGFTLVELMIVIVIVGILAAVAVPIYRANIESAKSTEADAALGTIRTALRVHRAANSAYPIQDPVGAVTAVSELDLMPADLDGKFFKAGSYTYLSSDGSSYLITATGADSTDSGGITRTMDNLGDLN